MARLPYVDQAAASPEVRDALERAPSLNIFRMMANAETAFRPWLRWGQALLTKLELDPLLRELAILRVARLTPHADYEWVQHAGIAKAVGATDEQVAALERDDDEAECFSDLEQLVLRFTTEVVRDARASDEALDELTAALSPREVIELLMVIGQYMMVARVMATTHIDLDEPVDPADADEPMTSVRDASYELLREHGLTTVFGNPGSTELPFLSAFPSDFRYVLGLQEAIVVGMADGYAQASGRPTLVNLHTAPGVGNAMGALFNARENKSPLVVTAGQQVRAMMTIEALLTNRDSTTLPRPVTKWNFEPPRPQDVPSALARATHLAALPPRGPVFVSIPMDDWAAEADEQVSRPVTGRSVAGRTAPNPEAIADLARRLGAASNPVLIAGPDVDASGAWDTAVALAERCRLPVWSTPASGSGRLGFPENHPQFQGTLPPAIAPVAQTLEGHDLVLVAGAAVFTYYPYIPGPYVPEGASLVQLTSDPDEAARAPVGDAILGDVALALTTLLEQVPESDRPLPPVRPAPEPPEDSDPITATAAAAALAEVFPDNGILVNEAPSSVLAFRNQVRLARAGSYFFGAGGGLGYGLPATIGVQLAQPERPVVGVIGDGSMQYAIAALWSAVAYEVPATVLVLRNEEYAILKWFAEFEGEMGAPGLDVAGLDSVMIASGYGMRARRVEGSAELRTALADAIASDQPELIEVRIAPGMSLG